MTGPNWWLGIYKEAPWQPKGQLFGYNDPTARVETWDGGPRSPWQLNEEKKNLREQSIHESYSSLCAPVSNFNLIGGGKGKLGSQRGPGLPGQSSDAVLLVFLCPPLTGDSCQERVDIV